MRYGCFGLTDGETVSAPQTSISGCRAFEKEYAGLVTPSGTYIRGRPGFRRTVENQFDHYSIGIVAE